MATSTACLPLARLAVHRNCSRLEVSTYSRSIVFSSRFTLPRNEPLPLPNQTGRRLFTTTIQKSQAATPKPLKDPYHPSGLYFHQLPDSNRYAVSFLSQPPSSPTSASIIAYITPPASSQEAIYDLAVQKPDLVEANKSFLELMHDTLKNECVPQDGLLEYEAVLRKDGWAHLNDQRHPLMPGRIATPENIIASVAFTDETLRTESYEANGVYRIVTAEEGFIDLRPNWLMFIKKKCEEVN